METTDTETATKMPIHLKKMLRLTLWLLIAIILIKIFKIDYLGFPVDKIPEYFKWLTVSKLIMIYIVFLFGNYGWSRKDRYDEMNSADLLFILLYEGIIRILFIILVVLVLKTPYEVLIYFILPEFFEYRMMPWILIWLFIFLSELTKR